MAKWRPNIELSHQYPNDSCIQKLISGIIILREYDNFILILCLLLTFYRYIEDMSATRKATNPVPNPPSNAPTETLPAHWLTDNDGENGTSLDALFALKDFMKGGLQAMQLDNIV